MSMDTPSTKAGAIGSARSSDRPGGGQTVPSIARAVRILNALASGPPSASLATLSRRLQLPRSSALSICNTLVDTGLLVRDGDGTYRLGPQILALSRAFLSQTDLHTEFGRVVAELNVLPQQTIVCSVLRDRDVVYIGRRPGRYPLGVNYEVGTRLPAHCTASGVALLGGLSDEAIVERFAADDGRSLPSLTARSISSVGELLERVAEARQLGYAVDDEETAIGMLGVGAVVRDSAGDVVGAVAASIAKAAVQEREVPGIAADVQRLAAQVSARLGAPLFD